ncbi:hypothetical protein CRG98_036732 [Punica granatum]|uniref:Ubiquitin carboxyl-terminal hydrolase 7 ICP0-binding domain-containing protein n=1 Tax=Punica granatum TaxID=22663 RepID=A0A2I0IG07_PUNGR|nr:hypothetical protein CRG98_036732 [Punica granatum]
MDEPTYKIIRVALDRDLIEQIGRDIYFDVVDHDRVRTFHVQKQTPFKLFKVGKLKQISKKAKELKLFLEVEFGLHRGPVSPPVKSMEDILLFFKLYDPEKGELRYVGRLFVNRYAKPCDILGKVNEMAGFSPDEEVDLYEFIGAAETSGSREGPSSGTQTSHMLPRAPSSEEVENAKQSLKECLSDLFKLNMKDRLASALSTLSIAETGLSDEQRSSVLEFRVNFDDFISDYLTFEQDNSEYELQKLQNDLLSSAMKKNRETHLSYKELSEKLAREEEELKKKLEETKSRNAKLISDWEALMAESEETKSKYVSQKPKLAEAEERKRIAEERMSRSTAACFVPGWEKKEKR